MTAVIPVPNPWRGCRDWFGSADRVQQVLRVGAVSLEPPAHVICLSMGLDIIRPRPGRESFSEHHFENNPGKRL
jgi:hypothetical protein